jgi:3-oxoacyl-[acyl-carrier-protein] synthase II
MISIIDQKFAAKQNMKPRIVVTGLGAVTPLGGNFHSSWEALIAGRDGQARLELFDTTGCRCHHAASASLSPLDDLPAKIIRRLSRTSRLAIPAAREALAQAGLLDAEGRSTLHELPISVSTTSGGMAFGEDFVRRVLARKRTHLFDQVARYLPQQQVLDLQQTIGFSGHSVIIANACASGANAIGHAADLISVGAADCVLAGGFEAITELVFVGFDCLQATSTDSCRPFDLNRTGLLIGEAAAFLVLESAEHAHRRGANILCDLTGYAHTTDVFHLTQPQPEGAALIEVMRAAAKAADISPAQIGYINAHGTATPVNDGVEAKAYAAFLGGALGATRISSTKAAIGHTLGAAGAIEALFAIEALRTGQLAPQLNLHHPIPEIAPALVGAHEPARDLQHVMSVNLGFGGSNAALVFSRSSQ